MLKSELEIILKRFPLLDLTIWTLLPNCFSATSSILKRKSSVFAVSLEETKQTKTLSNSLVANLIKLKCAFVKTLNLPRTKQPLFPFNDFKIKVFTFNSISSLMIVSFFLECL